MIDIILYDIISCQKQANLLINPIITISHLICHLFTILISFTLDLIHFFRKKSSYDTSNHLRKRESQAWNCKPLLLIKINSVCGATGDSHKILWTLQWWGYVQSMTERQRSHRWDERSIIKPSRSTFLSLFFSSFLSFYPFTHESPLRAFREWPIAIKRNETKPEKREGERQRGKRKKERK